MAAGAPRQREGANKATRRLIYIPIVHTQADLGALRETAARRSQLQLGQRGWQRKVRAIEQIWTEVEQVLGGLKLSYDKVRLYQDGLPVCGREAAVVAELAHSGSRNHQILRDLMAKGATLMGTESWELLQEEYRLARESLAAARPCRSCRPSRPSRPSRQPAGAPAPPSSGGDELLDRRDRFIARRINETLKEGETGILFLGMLHAIEKYLSPDIQVMYPCRSPHWPRG
jgi:hypothetical protein